MQDNKIGLIDKNLENHPLSKIKDKAILQLDSIVESLPSEVNQLINKSFIHKRVPKEYLLSSILFAFSNAAGLAFKINSMNYTNYANLYFAIIGSRGDVKSPAMELACSPLKLKDDENYIKYKNDLNEAKNNSALENKPIKRKQFLIQNATVEAAMFNHLQNPYSIGIYVDELSYLIEKMANKNSSEGSVWRVFLLQGNTNKHIDVIRKTTESYRVEKSYPTLLGSIQTEFIPKMFGDGNLESGFIDRLLFTNKLVGNNEISKSPMPPGVLCNYSNLLNNLLDYRFHIEKANTDFTVVLEKEVNDAIYKYSQDLLNKQQKMFTSEKEYVSKMMINIHKLTLLVHLIKTASNNSFQDPVTLETVDLAILINEFYFTNFRMIMESNKKTLDNKTFLNHLIETAKANNAEQRDIVKVTGASKGYVSKLWNKKV